MRQYDDPVEVRRGRGRGPRPVPVARPAVEGARRARALGGDRPVVAVRRRPGGDRHGRRRRAGAGSAADLLAERELWRVEAGRGVQVADAETYGVFDLSFDWTDGRWQLVGCAD